MKLPTLALSALLLAGCPWVKVVKDAAVLIADVCDAAAGPAIRSRSCPGTPPARRP